MIYFSFRINILFKYDNNQRVKMKSVFTFFIAMMMSSVLFAASETSSVRTANGQLVSLGDSFSDMATRMDQSPKSMNTYEIKEDDVVKTVSDYVYEVSGVTYTFTVINNQVRKILWSRD